MLCFAYKNCYLFQCVSACTRRFRRHLQHGRHSHVTSSCMLSHFHIASQLIIASVVSSGHFSYCSVLCQVDNFLATHQLSVKYNSNPAAYQLYIRHGQLCISWQDTYIYTVLHTLLRILLSQPLFANIPLHTPIRPHNVLHSSSNSRSQLYCVDSTVKYSVV